MATRGCSSNPLGNKAVIRSWRLPHRTPRISVPRCAPTARHRTHDGWGYRPLDQIDRDNVGDLRMVWTRALAPSAQQGTPIAYGGTLYMPNLCASASAR